MDAVTYALLKKQISGIAPGYNFRGTTTYANLPSSENTSGDLYIVTDRGNSQFIWNGSAWIQLYSDIASNAQIDGLYS